MSNAFQTRPYLLSSILASVVSLAACASADTVSDRRAVRYDDSLNRGHNAEKHDIFIQDRVADVCELPKNTSFFAPGSAGVDEVDRAVAHRVAECMRDGKLQKGYVVVVGYADPRGTAHYNKLLGFERAQAMAAALVAEGVPSDRLFIKSYGESKAGDAMTEADYAQDRKVTLRVAQPREM